MPIAVSTTSRRRGAARREQILRAAAELFARHGFHGVSIDDLGTAVGISGPALYRYFSGKEAVLGELLVGISEVLLNEGRRRSSAARCAGEALHALIDWHVTFALDHPALITVQNRDLAQLADREHARVRSLQRQYVEIWVSTICEAYEGLGRQEARGGAHAVFGLINSTPYSATLDREKMAGLLARMAAGALSAAGATSSSQA